MVTQVNENSRDNSSDLARGVGVASKRRTPEKFNGTWKAGRLHGGEDLRPWTEGQIWSRKTIGSKVNNPATARQPKSAEELAQMGQSFRVPARPPQERYTLTPYEREQYKRDQAAEATWRHDAARREAAIRAALNRAARAQADIEKARAAGQRATNPWQTVRASRALSAAQQRHAAALETAHYHGIHAHTWRSNLSVLQGTRDLLARGKIAAKWARDQKLAPLRAHLAGLKSARTVNEINTWLYDKYPHLQGYLHEQLGKGARGKPITLSPSIARRVAASYATLAREFPDAAQRISQIGFNHSESNPGARYLAHSTRDLGGEMSKSAPGTRAIGLSPAIARRGGLKGAVPGANGKPMTLEAMMRQAFAPAVQDHLVSSKNAAYAKWAAKYGQENFVKAFTNLAYGRAAKGQRGEGRSTSVRALKRALSQAYPDANLTQKPIRPTS